jgi:hypothetical protein
MYRNPVISSNIKSVGYDALTQVLEVEFISGDIYQYKSVPEHIYLQLTTAPSIGSAIHKIIRGKFEYIKMEK